MVGLQRTGPLTASPATSSGCHLVMSKCNVDPTACFTLPSKDTIRTEGLTISAIKTSKLSSSIGSPKSFLPTGASSLSADHQSWTSPAYLIDAGYDYKSAHFHVKKATALVVAFGGNSGWSGFAFIQIYTAMWS